MGRPDPSTLRLDKEIFDHFHKSPHKNIFCSATKRHASVEELRNEISTNVFNILDKKSSNHIDDLNSQLKLYEELDIIGWHHVNAISSEKLQISMCIWDSSRRKHDFEIYFPSSYPCDNKPVIETNLMFQISHPWNSQSTLHDILSYMESTINKYQAIFEVTQI